MRDSVYGICPHCGCHITMTVGKSLTVERVGTEFLVSFICTACGTDVDLSEQEVTQ